MRTRSSVYAKEYEIDKIVGRKLDDKGNHLYRVRWKGHEAEDDSWRLLDDLKNAKQAVAEYERQSSADKRGKKDVEGNREVVGREVVRGMNEDDDKAEGWKKAAKVAHFAGSVEKLEQRIVGGDWQKVIESLKE